MTASDFMAGKAFVWSKGGVEMDVMMYDEANDALMYVDHQWAMSILFMNEEGMICVDGRGNEFSFLFMDDLKLTDNAYAKN